MTPAPTLDADDVFIARVDSLVSSLVELRTRIDAAGRSEFAVLELVRSVDGFWRDQGPLLRQVTTTVLEALRVQALEQAYGWREQLARSLEAQARRYPE